MTRLHELSSEAAKARKRVGRGIGSGKGKTAGKGHKGQKARSGGTKGPGFEGGQMPLQRRLPAKGFSNAPFKKEFATVNVETLNRFDADAVVTPEELLATNVIRKMQDGVKVLGEGNLEKPLTVRAHRFSRSAIEKIEAAGGKAEVIS